MRVVIPAAGYATRLYPLTHQTPKPLLPVGDKPILEHIINNVLSIDSVSHIYVVTNHKFHEAFKLWLGSFNCKIPVSLFDDGTTSNDDRLGQIGDIQFVLSKIPHDQDILVVAGDNLFNFSLKSIYSVFKEKNAIVNPLFDSKSIEVAKQQGTVVLDGNGRFIEFMEKSPEPKTTLISQGVYFIPKDKISLFAKYLLERPDMADKMGYFMSWLIEKNEEVIGVQVDAKWFDVGWKEALETARTEFKGFK